MKRFGVIIVALSIILLIAGCNSKDKEESELELGIEALDNENVKDAKKHFDKASEDDEKQANEYVDAIESAERINESVKEDDLDEAIDTYLILENDEKFSSVQFIFVDEEEKITKIIEERTKIDEKINALKAFFDPEDPEMSANDLYILKSGDLLEQEHLTSEQEEAIKEFQTAINKRIAELASGIETGQQDSEEEKENVNEETDKKEEKVEEEKKEEEEQNKEENESKVLSHEEARDLVYKHLYGEDAVYTDDSNFKLDYDHDDGDTFVFHLYEVVENEGNGGHTATVGWYAIDSKTGKVTDIME